MFEEDIIKLNGNKKIQIGEYLPGSKLDEIVWDANAKKVETLEKSFNPAIKRWNYFVNYYDINDNELIRKKSALINERDYNRGIEQTEDSIK